MARSSTRAPGNGEVGTVDGDVGAAEVDAAECIEAPSPRYSHPMTPAHFTPVPLDKSWRLMNHGPTVLVSSAHGGRRNVMAAAWNMPLDFDPPKVAVVIDKSTYTRELIEASGEFVLAVPSQAIAAQGGSRLQQLATGVLPQVVPSFLATVLFRLDVNFRSSTVLGLVGAGGLGELARARALSDWTSLLVSVPSAMVPSLLGNKGPMPEGNSR